MVFAQDVSEVLGPKVDLTRVFISSSDMSKDSLHLRRHQVSVSSEVSKDSLPVAVPRVCSCNLSKASLHRQWCH